MPKRPLVPESTYWQCLRDGFPEQVNGHVAIYALPEEVIDVIQLRIPKFFEPIELKFERYLARYSPQGFFHGRRIGGMNAHFDEQKILHHQGSSQPPPRPNEPGPAPPAAKDRLAPPLRFPWECTQQHASLDRELRGMLRKEHTGR